MDSGRAKEACIVGAHWRHLVNNTEPSMPNYFDHLFYFVMEFSYISFPLFHRLKNLHVSNEQLCMVTTRNITYFQLFACLVHRSVIFLYRSLCLKKGYHPTTNDNFNNQIYRINMPPKSGFVCHLTCLLYASYLGKLQDPKNHEFSLKL